MTTVILVSLLAPIAAGALLLAARHRLPKLVADARGIALQTVIVIVVMLAIAGGVAAVLLSTGGEVSENLANQDLSAQVSTEAECNAYTMRNTDGEEKQGVKHTNNKCRWDAGTSKQFSAIVCSAPNGVINGQYCETRNDIT